MARKPAPAPALVEVRVIRSRGVTLDGTHHPFGAALALPANQIADLVAVGAVTDRPAAPAPESPAGLPAAD